MRSEATIGVRIHGIVAAMAVLVESSARGMRERYRYPGGERTRGAPLMARLS